MYPIECVKLGDGKNGNCSVDKDFKVSSFCKKRVTKKLESKFIEMMEDVLNVNLTTRNWQI